MMEFERMTNAKFDNGCKRLNARVAAPYEVLRGSLSVRRHPERPGEDLTTEADSVTLESTGGALTLAELNAGIL